MRVSLHDQTRSLYTPSAPQPPRPTTSTKVQTHSFSRWRTRWSRSKAAGATTQTIPSPRTSERRCGPGHHAAPRGQKMARAGRVEREENYEPRLLDPALSALVLFFFEVHACAQMDRHLRVANCPHHHHHNNHHHNGVSPASTCQFRLDEGKGTRRDFAIARSIPLIHWQPGDQLCRHSFGSCCPEDVAVACRPPSGELTHAPKVSTCTERCCG